MSPIPRYFLVFLFTSWRSLLLPEHSIYFVTSLTSSWHIHFSKQPPLLPFTLLLLPCIPTLLPDNSLLLPFIPPLLPLIFLLLPDSSSLLPDSFPLLFFPSKDYYAAEIYFVVYLHFRLKKHVEYKWIVKLNNWTTSPSPSSVTQYYATKAVRTPRSNNIIFFKRNKGNF